jgi:hypothetical protein
LKVLAYIAISEASGRVDYARLVRLVVIYLLMYYVGHNAGQLIIRHRGVIKCHNP